MTSARKPAGVWIAVGVGALVVGASLTACASSTSVDDAALKDQLAKIEAHKSPSRGAASTSPTPAKSTKPKPSSSSRATATRAVSSWASFPWGESDGKECAPPTAPASSGKPIVVLGDSLIRNAQPALEADLSSRGYAPTFICWGGKQTTWGMEQIGHMRDLGLLPECLVVNLGTNDVKKDRGNQPAEVLQSRLIDLINDTEGVKDLLLVNIWGKPGALMPAMEDKVPVYPAAIAAAGKGRLVDWASVARSNPDYVEPEGVHDTSAGSAVRAQMIADAVASTCN